MTTNANKRQQLLGLCCVIWGTSQMYLHQLFAFLKLRQLTPAFYFSYNDFVNSFIYFIYIEIFFFWLLARHFSALFDMYWATQIFCLLPESMEQIKKCIFCSLDVSGDRNWFLDCIVQCDTCSLVQSRGVL
jgi:hypothetical protein